MSRHYVFPLCIAAWTATAAADGFDVTGQTGIPSDNAIQGNLYNNNLGGDISVAWFGNATGSFTMTYPVTVAFSTGPTVMDSYFKNDNSSNVITLRYLKQKKSNGAVTTIATITSNAATSNGLYQHVAQTFADTYDQSTYRYMLIVNLARGVIADQRWYVGSIH